MAKSSGGGGRSGRGRAGGGGNGAGASKIVTRTDIFGNPYSITVTPPTQSEMDRLNNALKTIENRFGSRINTSSYRDEFVNRLDAEGRDSFLKALGA